MSTPRNILGLIAGVILVLSSGPHTFMGWQALGAELAKTIPMLAEDVYRERELPRILVSLQIDPAEIDSIRLAAPGPAS